MENPNLEIQPLVAILAQADALPASIADAKGSFLLGSACDSQDAFAVAQVLNIFPGTLRSFRQFARHPRISIAIELRSCLLRPSNRMVKPPSLLISRLPRGCHNMFMNPHWKCALLLDHLLQSQHVQVFVAAAMRPCSLDSFPLQRCLLPWLLQKWGALGCWSRSLPSARPSFFIWNRVPCLVFI